MIINNFEKEINSELKRNLKIIQKQFKYKKDIILLISTKEYIKYINNFIDSYFLNNHYPNKIIIFSIKEFESNDFEYKKNVAIDFYDFFICKESLKYIKQISANIRFHILKLLIPFSKTILYLDCDSVVLKDLSKMYKKFSNYSICLRKHSNHKNGTKNHFYPIKSGFIYLKNNNVSINFLNEAISDISKFINIWYADQKAISTAYFKIQYSDISQVFLFNKNYFDWWLIPEPNIFTAKGLRKRSKIFIYFSKIIKNNKNIFIKKSLYFLITIETMIRDLLEQYKKIFTYL